MDHFILALWFIVALFFLLFNFARCVAAFIEGDDTTFHISLMFTLVQLILVFAAWGSALHYKGF